MRRGEQNARVIEAADGGWPSYCGVTHLVYDDLASLREGIASEGGHTTIADLDNFATGGVTLLVVVEDRSGPHAQGGIAWLP